MANILGYHTVRFDAQVAIWAVAILFVSLNLPVAGYLLWSPPAEVDFFSTSIFSLFVSLLLSTSMFVFGLNSRALQADDAVFLVRLALALGAGAVVVGVALHSFPQPFVDWTFLLLGVACAFFAMLLTRGALSRMLSARSSPRGVIIVGTGERAREVTSSLERSRAARYEVAGYFEPPLTSSSGASVPKSRVLGDDQSLVCHAIQKNVSEIIVAVDDRRGSLPINALLEAKLKGIEVTDLVAFYERECSTIKFEHMHPSWIVFSSGFRLGAGKRAVKRTFDLMMSGFLLVLTAPVMALVAVASLVESGGRDPVLYFQERVGFGGKPFKLCKFRSMAVSAEQDGVARWAKAKDDRVTPLGRVLRRYRLDELPQLFNVFVGDMSLVGPRPERPEFVNNLAAMIHFYAERHCVKPGLAGWAQLMYPYGSSIEDAKKKLEYDLYYVKHSSVVLDLVILLRTFEVVLLGKGVR